jgi:hypothetical protein
LAFLIGAIGSILIKAGRLPSITNHEGLLLVPGNACFVVRDQSGQQLAYVCFENERGRRSAAKLLSKGEAHGITANVAKLLNGSRS